jgi:hypothetical protein
MKNKIFFAILTLTAFLVIPLFSQEANAGGIIYGDKWAFMVKAPDGWIMDSNSLSAQGIYGLFYEEGKIFGAQYDTPIIYIVPFPLNNATDNALIEFAQTDINGYISNGAKVEKINKTYEKTRNLYLTYNVNLPNGRYESFVYTRYKDCCLIIILNANNHGQRNNLFLKLEEVINSISFMDRN